MKYTFTLPLLLSLHYSYAQLNQPGTRTFHFYDEKGIALDSNNKSTKQYSIYVSYIDYDGNKTPRKKQRLSKSGEWGGLFDRSPMTFFMQIIKGRDTMNVTIRHIFSRLFTLDGIHFVKGNYEADFYSDRDTTIHSIHIDNWWGYRTNKNPVNPLSLVMEGTIIDKDSGEPVPLATIAIPAKRWGQTGDVNGKFKLELARHITKMSDHVVVYFSCVGYDPLQLVIHPKMLPVLQQHQLQIPMQKSSTGTRGHLRYGLRKVAGYTNRYELTSAIIIID